MLTTEQLRARAKFWREKAVEAKRESVSIAQDMLQNADAFDELAANREAQPVGNGLGEIRVGNLPTMNQEEYPGLGDWWVQLRIGANHDEILARVYGATPEEAVARARLLTAPPAPAVPEIDELRLKFERAERESDDGFNLHKYGIGYADEATQARWESWLACRAAMLAAEPGDS